MEKEIEKKVLARIRPTAQESNHIQSAASEVVSRVTRESSGHVAAAGGPITPVIVGSVAKGTYLKEADVDVFMTFPVSTSRDVLERIATEIGKKVLEHPVLKYAEHPYIRGKVGDVTIDLVPCYAITDPSMKMSAVDRTPFQSEFVNRHIQSFQRDEVRLLKRFFKGIGVYGAEAKVNGFSGYLTELLVMTYGTFISTVNAISSWKKGESALVPGTSLGDKLSAQDNLLTIPDPVDANRNVAAALGPDSFSMAVIACRRYLRRPDARFFFPAERRPATVSEIRKAVARSGHGFLLLSMEKPDIVDDNLYPQLQKARRNITALLERNGFGVNRSLFSVETEVKILFELGHRQQPDYWLREGPAGWSDNSFAFVEKHRKAGGNIFLVDGTLFSEEKKPYSSPAQLVGESIDALSLGADIDGVKKRMQLAADEDVVIPGNREILTRLLFYRFPWEY